MKKYIHYCDCCKTELTEDFMASTIIIKVDDNHSLECSCLDLCDVCKDKIKTGMKNIQITEFRSAWPTKSEIVLL